jgi:hypothetical protein
LPLNPPLQTPLLEFGIVLLKELLVCGLYISYESRAAETDGTTAVPLLEEAQLAIKSRNSPDKHLGPQPPVDGFLAHFERCSSKQINTVKF